MPTAALTENYPQESWEGDQPKVTQVAERGPRGISAARSTQSLRAGATARPEALPTAVPLLVASRAYQLSSALVGQNLGVREGFSE